MSIEEKAKELIGKFRKHSYPPIENNGDGEFEKSETRIAKACAIICVDEILNGFDSDSKYFVSEMRDRFYPALEYWLNVKEEIKKI